MEPLAELKKLIDFMQTVYTKITKEWFQVSTRQVNLKKRYVSDIELDGEIYKAIAEYIQLLNERSANFSLSFDSICASPTSSRVKNLNSVEYKIQRYKSDEQHELGKVPINKCFNDLFGARIILDPPIALTDILAFISSTYANEYRCMDASKLDYKAVHLYLRAKQDNRAFPWELQIWNLCDAEKNLISHNEYKQGYTSWEKESKKGGIISG